MTVDRAVSRRDFLTGTVAGALAIAAGGSLTACGSGDAGPASEPSGPPKKGGQLRFGLNQATSTDSLDLQHAVTDFEAGGGLQMHEGLLKSRNGQLTRALAEEVNQDGTTSLTVRLKQGVEFHNGKTVTADDVLASVRRMLDPANPGGASGFLADIDPNASKTLDARTVRFALRKPNVFVKDGLGAIHAAIYPEGRWDDRNPVGAGPFRLRRQEPGTGYEFERFANYHGDPSHVDSLVFQNFADPAALGNALTSGVLDLAGGVPPTLARTLGEPIKVVRTASGGFAPFVMRADTAPFDDVRVRQAFRLLVDRQRLVDQLQDGSGRLGNDLYSPDDPSFAKDIPQRQQDLDQARSLLAAAGAQGMRLTMATSGFVANGEVALAEQALRAGVQIDIQQVDQATFFAQHYGKDPLFLSLWYALPVVLQTISSIIPGAFYPEAGWNNERFLALLAAASADPDETTRGAKLHEMQKLFHEEGPYLIWGFRQQIDAMAPHVHGNRTDTSGLPFAYFDFASMWLD